MDTKDANRLRTAVKDNNLVLVKRLIGRTNIRNPDPAFRHYTSLAWAAVLGHEETFEFLLNAGHDDEELSKDSENNTILMLLADLKSTSAASYPSDQPVVDAGAALRMAHLYYYQYRETYPDLLDWSDRAGKTALHHASLKGNEELVRMLCRLGADYDLADNLGNTPLHYASAWGHIPIVQLLIEHGCQYTARNNSGFTASDYAYSFGTRDTLQDTARTQWENNKMSRRAVFAQAASRGYDRNGSPVPGIHPATVPAKARDINIRQTASRMRSGSGTSRTTNTSDSGDCDPKSTMPSQHSQSSQSASSSPSHPSPNYFSSPSHTGHGPSLSTTSSSIGHSSSLVTSSHTASALSPIASRMRERDADAMEKYLNRNRSGSSSTDNRSQQGSVYSGSSRQPDDFSTLATSSGASTPRRLRPSASATQLRATPEHTPSSSMDYRSRAGTTSSSRSVQPAPGLLSRSSSASGTKTLNGSHYRRPVPEQNEEKYTGPPSRYARFPDPPVAPMVEDNATPTGRRLAFNILMKPQPTISESTRPGHRRDVSAASLR